MEKIIDTFSNRLAQAMQIRKIKAAELSEKTGIPKSSLSEYLKGKYQAKPNAVCLLSNVLNVDQHWLLGYDVPMENAQKTEIGDLYMHLAREAQNLNLDKEDVDYILSFYKKHKK